ncbi:MAG: hypothetical protein IPP62_17905 [bacterium]|nr:hypothetical protein [bacterium]
MARSDALLNFSWRGGTPAPRLNRGTWGANWYGQIRAPVTGMYTFHVSSGGNSCEVRIDGKLLLNKTGEMRQTRGWKWAGTILVLRTAQTICTTTGSC